MSDGVITVTGVIDAPIQQQADAAAASLVQRMQSSNPAHTDWGAINRALNDYWNRFYKNLHAANDLLKANIDTSDLDMNNADVKQKVDQLELAIAKLMLEVAKDGYLDFSNAPGVDMTSASANDAFKKMKFDLRYKDDSFHGGRTTFNADGTRTIEIDIADGNLYSANAAAGLNYILFHEMGHAVPIHLPFYNARTADFEARTGFKPEEALDLWKTSAELKDIQAHANSLGQRMAQEAGAGWPTPGEMQLLDGYYML